MWINFEQLLDLPNVTVVNYQKIDETIFLKLALLNETIECPNCHQTLDRINQTEYNLVRDLSILGNRVYLEVPRRPPPTPRAVSFSHQNIKSKSDHCLCKMRSDRQLLNIC